MEGLVLSSSSSTSRCMVFSSSNRVTHTYTTTNNSILFQQTTHKNHFHLLLQRASASSSSRGAAVVVAVSGNSHEPQQDKQEHEQEDEDDTNTIEQEQEELASFLTLSANPQDEDEEDDDQVEETKPIQHQQQVFAAPAVSTTLKLIFNWLLNQFSSFLKKDHHPTTTTNNSSQPGTTTSTRAGLFRTPISGGVQSATSNHDLPPPPLAVRNLMEQARFAHLCTVMSRMHHRREGYPFGSLVDFGTDAMGHPIFSFSPLAIHTRNLLADPRCTLVVQIPGWSGLSNARVTIFGDVVPLPEDQQEWAHQQYIAKHHQGPSQKWGNFYYFRMQNISDIYFIGGFGTVAWVNVSEYEALRPDKIAVDGGEQNLKELNAIFSKPIKELLSLETEVDDAALISIDSKGTDVRVRQGAQFNIQRLAFEEGHGVETLEEAKAALWNLIHKGGGLKLDHKF